MDNLQIIFITLACFYISNSFAKTVENISDSLAVETTVDTITVITSSTPEAKSKTEKRDSADQIGSTIFTLKEDENFRPITSETYREQVQSHPHQFELSPSSSTFQPTTVRYVAEEAAPQLYYDRPPNVVRDVSHVLPTTGNGKVSDYVSGGVQYATPSNVYRGPYREPYELAHEQTHSQRQPHMEQQQQQQQQELPHPHNLQQQQQQQQFQPTQRKQSPQYAQPVKASPNLDNVSPPAESGFIPLQGLVQQQPPYYFRQEPTQPNIHFPQRNEQQRQQQYTSYQKPFQQQAQYVALQKQSLPPQQQLQQQQFQQPGRQQINYIIAIPLSYVRQLQHQLASQHEPAPPAPPASASPTPQNQQQSSSLVPLQTPRSHVPPLLVLQPITSGGGATNDLYRLQSPIHYAPPAPTRSNPEVNSHPQAAPALAPQQLPYPMNLVLTAAPVRPRQTIYPASQLLYVQPQLIRQIPQQQLQLELKQHQHFPRYVQKPEEPPQRAEERNTQQRQQPQEQPQPQSQPQQHEHPRVTYFVPKPTVKQVLVPLQAAGASSSQPSNSIPTKSTLPHTPPIIFYNPAYVQPPPLEQHPLPTSPYANHIQAQFGSGQHATSLVKLAAFSPHYYPVHNVRDPQNLLISKVPIQIQQATPQQSFVNRPSVYMAPQDIINGIKVSETGGGLPFFMHPAGLHYGTHLYNPGIPLGVSSKLLESGDLSTQQQHQIQQFRSEHHRKHQQQGLASTGTSGGNTVNNAIVKYP